MGFISLIRRVVILPAGDTGAGKMPEPETLFSYIMKDLACEKDMVGKKVMVTAGIDTGED